MKRITSFVLALAMMLSFLISVNAATTDNADLLYSASDERCISLCEAVEMYEEENNVKLETYRNYFYIPDGTESFFEKNGCGVPTWYNEYFTDVCIWYDDSWCENAPVPSSYCGYSISKTNIKNIYYADIPVGVNSFLINNGVDEISVLHRRCEIVAPLGPDNNCDYQENYVYCDNMIYVISEFDSGSMSLTARFYGDWYYYLGNGCYVEFEDGECKNPNHYDENGQHTIVQAVIGDTDLDGEISVLDATAIQRYLASLEEFTQEQLIAADVDGDGEVTVLDATLVQQYVASIITCFPVEE